MVQATTWGVPLVSPATPTVMATRMDDSLDALLSLQKGGSRPSYAVAGTLWINDTANPWLLNLYDGAADRLLASYNTSTNIFVWGNVQTTAWDSTDTKVLTVGAFGLGETAAAPGTTNGDCDDTVTSGLWRIVNTTLNRPFDYGTMLVAAYDGGLVTQIAQNVANGSVWSRSLGSVPTAWTQIQTAALANFKSENTMTTTIATNSTIAVTGVGFTPRFLHGMGSAEAGYPSIGMGLSGGECLSKNVHDGAWQWTDGIAAYTVDASNHCHWLIHSLDADGFTLQYKKTGTVTNAFTLHIYCIR